MRQSFDDDVDPTVVDSRLVHHVDEYPFGQKRLTQVIATDQIHRADRRPSGKSSSATDSYFSAACTRLSRVTSMLRRL